MRTTSDSRLAFGLLIVSLLALGAFVAVGFRPLSSRRLRDPEAQAARAPPQAGTEFVDVTAAWGLASNHHYYTDGVRSIAEAVAPGVGLLDLDGDDDLDIVQLAGPDADAGVVIWLNQMKESGRVSFIDATSEIGLRIKIDAQGVCAGDVDRDGDIDLFITAIGPNLLLLNQLNDHPPVNGKRVLRFVDATESAGVAGGRWHWIKPSDSQPPIVAEDSPLADHDAAHDVPEFSTGATFGDFDADGDLDLYVANYVAAFNERWGSTHGSSGSDRDDPPEFQPHEFEELHDRLYLNETVGRTVRFREVTRDAGVDDQRGRGLGVSFMLIDADIYPDIYLLNDASANVFLHNVAATPDTSAPANDAAVPVPRRRFEVSAGEFGLYDNRSGMGIARGDADADGDLDLLTTNFRKMSVSLFLFRQELTPVDEHNEVHKYAKFDERGAATGLAKDTAPLVGWGCVFFDYDDDGDEDVFIGNGATSPRDLKQCAPERPLLYENRGDGTFDNVTASAGAALQVSYAARGVVAGDIDQDGDLDLLIAQNGGPLVVLENRRAANGNLSITIVPDFGSRGDAVNAVVVCDVGRRRIVRELLSGSSYLCQEPFEAHFGLGSRPRADQVRVTWPWLGAPPPTLSDPYPAGRVRISAKAADAASPSDEN